MSDNNSMSTHEILCTALDIGEHILRHGGEVSRVEDTIMRICKAYGAKHVEVFCITSIIISSISMENGDYSSQIRRVYDSDNDLYKLEMLNSVSRRLCQELPSRETASTWIAEAKKATPYSKHISSLGACIAVSAFVIFFGGTLRDSIAGALVQFLLVLINMIVPERLNKIAQTTIQSFLAGALSILAVRIGFAQNVDKVMIGTIMILIPGIAMGNSIRDIFNGDILSGVLRLFSSIVIALVIAFGFSVSLLWLGDF